MCGSPKCTSLGLTVGTKEKLLKLIRQQPACVLALQLDVTKHVSDEDIMAALAGSSENLDIDMRERKVPLEIIERILALPPGQYLPHMQWAEALRGPGGGRCGVGDAAP